MARDRVAHLGLSHRRAHERAQRAAPLRLAHRAQRQREQRQELVGLLRLRLEALTELRERALLGAASAVHLEDRRGPEVMEALVAERGGLERDPTTGEEREQERARIGVWRLGERRPQHDRVAEARRLLEQLEALRAHVGVTRVEDLAQVRVVAELLVQECGREERDAARARLAHRRVDDGQRGLELGLGVEILGLGPLDAEHRGRVGHVSRERHALLERRARGRHGRRHLGDDQRQHLRVVAREQGEPLVEQEVLDAHGLLEQARAEELHVRMRGSEEGLHAHDVDRREGGREVSLEPAHELTTQKERGVCAAVCRGSPTPPPSRPRGGAARATDRRASCRSRGRSCDRSERARRCARRAR